jgi:hypothetical protein
MYRLTIIPADKTVYFDDKVASDLDLSFLQAGIHALQWLNGAGWIEYDDPDAHNQPITELPDWAMQAYDLAVASYVPPVV